MDERICAIVQVYQYSQKTLFIVVLPKEMQTKDALYLPMPASRSIVVTADGGLVRPTARYQQPACRCQMRSNLT